MIPYAQFIKLGFWLGAAAFLFGLGYHQGAASSEAALEADRAAQSQAIANAVLKERAAAAATAAQDHATEAQHAKVILSIDSAPPIRTPVFVCEPPSPVRAGPMPGGEAQANRDTSDPATRGSERMGRERDIRPGIEALKRQLERVMADYRQMDAEWPK